MQANNGAPSSLSNLNSNVQPDTSGKCISLSLSPRQTINNVSGVTKPPGDTNSMPSAKIPSDLEYSSISSWNISTESDSSNRSKSSKSDKSSKKNGNNSTSNPNEASIKHKEEYEEKSGNTAGDEQPPTKTSLVPSSQSNPNTNDCVVSASPAPDIPDTQQKNAIKENDINKGISIPSSMINNNNLNFKEASSGAFLDPNEIIAALQEYAEDGTGDKNEEPTPLPKEANDNSNLILGNNLNGKSYEKKEVLPAKLFPQYSPISSPELGSPTRLIIASQCGSPPPKFSLMDSDKQSKPSNPKEKTALTHLMSELEFSSSDDPSLNGGSGNNSEDEKSVSSAENKSSDSEFTYNSREGITKVIKPVPSIDDHYRQIFGNELTVKFNATIPAESFGILEGPSQFLRMPHFIPVESKAYDALSLENLITPEDLKDEQSRNDFISRLKTTVRWREGPNKGMESNSRIVRWSDGSETFHVGGEVFDVMHHPVTDDHNHLYVRLDSLYQSHGTIKDKMTLRPKLDSNFGQRHVQGLRNRAMNKPQTGCVKVLMDMGANPVQDRERRAKEEMANLRKEEREKRREFQLNRRKPRVQPIYHCTADDTDVEPPRSDTESVVMPNNTQGITPKNQELGDEKVDNGGDIGESNEEDDSIDMSEDDDDLLDEPSCSNSKIKKANGSDSDESIQISNIYRKPKQLIYSDSD